MPLSKEQNYTLEDIYTLPDGRRAELIDGQIYNMAPPSTKHQVITGELFAAFRNYIRSKGGPCKVYFAPFAVFLDDDNRNYVEPDLSVVCDPDKVDEKGCHGTPDLIVEIVSPSSRRMDCIIKLFKYRSAGVREYWIVNPMKSTVQVYVFGENEDTVQFTFDEDIPVGIYPGFSVNIADLLK